MEGYLTTVVLHKSSRLKMQDERLREKFYLFMVVGIPTTDTTPT
mgnify:CR=1 FL=1